MSKLHGEEWAKSLWQTGHSNGLEQGLGVHGINLAQLGVEFAANVSASLSQLMPKELPLSSAIKSRS